MHRSYRTQQEKKMIFARLVVLSVVAFSFNNAYAGKIEVPPAVEAVERRSTVPKDAEIPEAVLEAWKKSYVPIRVSLELVSGKTQDSACGGYVYNKKERFVVSSYHCLPHLLSFLKPGKHFSVDGSPAEVVAKLPEGDLVLLRVEKLSDRVEDTRQVVAKIGDKAYVRSRLSFQVMESESATNPYALFFTSNWSSEITVSALGSIGFYQPKLENGQISEQFKNTKLKMYMFDGGIEQGMSGSPVFNEKGEVIGIATSSSETNSFATDIRNVEHLLARYNESLKKK